MEERGSIIPVLLSWSALRVEISFPVRDARLPLLQRCMYSKGDAPLLYIRHQTQNAASALTLFKPISVVIPSGDK